MAQRANPTPLSWIGGKPVFCFSGAEDAGNGNQGGNGGQNNGGQSGEGNNSNSGQSGQGAQSGASGQGGNGQSAGADTVSKAEYDALMARMAAADRNAATAQARVQELEGKDKTELEKAQQALADANKRIDELTKGRESMVLSNAFLTVKDTPTWHNTSAALALLDKSLITIGDDGKVTGMEAAVKKLQTDHPYLVKKADGQNGDGQGGNGQQQQGGQNGSGQQGGGGRASGSANNGQGGGGKGGPDRAALEKRFPALRGRVH
jgi:hypothetical protein